MRVSRIATFAHGREVSSRSVPLQVVPAGSASSIPDTIPPGPTVSGADNADAAPQSFTIAKGAAAFGGTIVNARLYSLDAGQFCADEIVMEPSASRIIDVTPTDAAVSVVMYCLGWVDPGCP